MARQFESTIWRYKKKNKANAPKNALQKTVCVMGIPRNTIPIHHIQMLQRIKKS
jgi:hypothetical protein